MPYSTAEESSNTNNSHDIPFAIRVLDWESLMSMIGLQFSIAYYILSATFDHAQWIDFHGNVKQGFGLIFRSEQSIESGRDDHERAHEIRKGGLIIACAWLAISIPAVFIYWLVVEGVVAAAVKAVVETTYVIGSSISACCGWIKNSSINLAAKLHNKIFGQQQKQPDNSYTEMMEDIWKKTGVSVVPPPEIMTATVVPPPEIMTATVVRPLPLETQGSAKPSRMCF